MVRRAFPLLILSLGSLASGEVLLGVTARGSENGPHEVARWEGNAQPIPEGWQGHPVELIGISLGGAKNWGSLAEYGVNYLEENCRWAGDTRKAQIELAVPMFPTGWEVGVSGWQRALGNQAPNPIAKDDRSLASHERFEQGGLPYLTYFEQLAQNLVRTGYGESILRLGWEFNGDWFEWGDKGLGDFVIGNQTYNHPRAYREIYRKIHDTMMAVEGANFRWSWCSALGAKGYSDDAGAPLDYREWFPGTDAVDFVSVDYFDDEVRFYPGRDIGVTDEAMKRLTWLAYLLQVEGREVGLSPLVESLGAEMNGRYPWAAHDFTAAQLNVLTAERFPTMASLRSYVTEKEMVTTGRPGLQWFRDFAAGQNLGFLVSEWGVWQNDPFEKPQIHFTGDDNPEFVRNFHTWLLGNDIPGETVGAIYFEEFNDLRRPGVREGFNHSLLDCDIFPKARQAHIDLFQKQGMKVP